MEQDVEEALEQLVEEVVKQVVEGQVVDFHHNLVATFTTTAPGTSLREHLPIWLGQSSLHSTLNEF